ncbi:hypothetical protein VOLCADRAFT_96835 [Volvox carteri f. nagariensis]|uniref:Uncharacterized protein n=1 Tax=Volvox carteri f. nagariensis TaxID=3068 RepID=D8UB68_VOLCA|nr:uncharacterized protein VOLCADRAFT_96835 [Volvox carteri f. nagariensis]EFJ43057.1 hypothetical protein VOLCADRAFT_96835 [Volvox carteri f. nagariensis]|eukprot:XP_002955856.1 hypothetical protein VOLCADRAFT_96835 [Volvox carteri f. nagariensis]
MRGLSGERQHLRFIGSGVTVAAAAVAAAEHAVAALTRRGASTAVAPPLPPPDAIGAASRVFAMRKRALALLGTAAAAEDDGVAGLPPPELLPPPDVRKVPEVPARTDADSASGEAGGADKCGNDCGGGWLDVGFCEDRGRGLGAAPGWLILGSAGGDVRAAVTALEFVLEDALRYFDERNIRGYLRCRFLFVSDEPAQS